MNQSLVGLDAVICGSSQGIGAASARALAEMGARVILFARNAERLEQVRKSLPGEGHVCLTADFTKSALVAETLSNYLAASGRQPTILVNNTGGPPGGPILDADAQAFLTAFEMHLLCAHGLSQVLVPFMKENSWGRIINIISTSVKAPLPRLGVSNTVRAAVANWSKTLSREVAPFGITVNNVLPGATKTARLDGIVKSNAQKSERSEDAVAAAMKAEIPAGRFGEAEEIAALVAFLASKEANYINGVSIPVDGGRTPNI